jgi:hypothetical protein
MCFVVNRTNPLYYPRPRRAHDFVIVLTFTNSEPSVTNLTLPIDAVDDTMGA